MTDIKQFNTTGNRVTFQLDEESFTVKYPEEYQWGREHLNIAKDIALCAWANKLAFTLDDDNSLCFEASDRQLGFWKWIAYRVHVFDVYENGGVEEPKNLREVNVETGSDPSSLIDKVLNPVVDFEGALVCQSPGKESVASKLILEENGISPIASMFYEYSSRAATHKIAGREEFEEYYDNPVIRVWSDTNSLQSTLQELTDEYEPITCFWEMIYATISVPLMVEHSLKYLMMGNQLDTGEAYPFGDHVAFAEINQSYLFEMAYTDYLQEEHNLPIVHSSNVRPFTGYTCRKIIAQEDPGWLPHMQNCLRPTTDRRWCLRCYKCCNAWVEFMACGLDPEEAGLSHDVLIENPHLGAEDTGDWGFSFPRYERDEMVWVDEGARSFFWENVKEKLTEEQNKAFITWRDRQEERVDQEKLDELRKYNGKFVEPVASVIPEELINDMELEHAEYVPERMDPAIWSSFVGEWRTFT